MNLLSNGIRYCITVKPEQPEEFTDEVYKRLSDGISEEPALLPTEPLALQWSFEGGFAVIAFDENVPVGYTRLHPLLAEEHPSGGWWELGTTLVLESHRSRGINKAMYELLLPYHKDRNIIATSINLASIAVGEQMDFVGITRKSLPEEVWRESCTCPLSKTGCSDGNVNCALAWQEPQHRRGGKTCFFRVTKETAQRHELGT